MANTMFKVELDTFDKQGNLIEKGGVVIDRLREVLGHVYDEKFYEKNGNRKPEYYKPKKKI